MAAFLLLFLLLYGGMNAYVFWKVRAAWVETAWVGWLVGAFCALMIIAPLFIRYLERHGAVTFSRVLAFVAFTWMALAFWFLILGVTGDLWNVGAKTAAHWQPGAAKYVLGARRHVPAIMVLVAIASIWGTIEASCIRLKTLRIPTPKLTASDGPVRIVQITDIHLSITRSRGMLGRVARIVREAQPDILVSTGDLSDVTFLEVNHLGALLNDLPVRWGKFACLGNHERYAGLDNGLAIHKASGLRVLRGEAVKAGPVIIAGVDDPAITGDPAKLRAQEKDALDAAHSLGDGPIVLLKHQPRALAESQGRFDLQLSGHTHGGQIFPFGFFAYAFNRVWPGLHQLPEGGWLYLSRGTGTWGPPFRLFSPPEVTLIILEPAS
jgi:hypothetical protein